MTSQLVTIWEGTLIAMTPLSPADLISYPHFMDSDYSAPHGYGCGDTDDFPVGPPFPFGAEP